MRKAIVLTCAAWALLHTCILAGPVVQITNKKGEALVAELISVGENSAKLKKSAGSNSFKVSFDLLSEESVKLLREKAEELPVVFPRFEVDVIVTKRRKSMSNSWYMKSMTVGAKVKVSNGSMRTDFPVTKARIVLLGQDQRIKTIYSVLSVKDFEISPKAGQEQEVEIPEFVTTYDSDNKGQGNVGGFKYEGYMLIFRDSKDRIAYSKSLDATISRAAEDNPKVLEAFLTMKVGEKLTDKMIPAPALR